ncbi:MAG: substrate-binding domain-containing protein, partial [Arthrobacter sp.]|nr:substrate-binding domain-containing protein [Arthrobacter sp.]
REGIDRALKNADTSLAGSVVVEDDWDIANGRAAVAGLLASGERPRALICVNDAVAIGAGHALRAAGLRLPDDVSLVSFDGTPLAQAAEPALTTIALPHLEMGRRAASLLSDPDRTPRRIRIPMPVIPGGSVSGPRTGP